MPRDTLTGSRIRERRVMAGLKQADLARRANISPSYLNLIEHNRRRIGGKLLNDIAQALGVDSSLLTEGAEATLLSALREAASESDIPDDELARIEEFAGRFPGWAGLLAENRRRVEALERSVESLTDRLAHDPHLAASLHEMLSTVTAIRSASSILAEPGDVEPEWQRRFNRNIYEDSARLAETSRALVQYLEVADSAPTDINSPQDELDDVLERHGHHFPDLEHEGADPEAVIAQYGHGLSSAAFWLLQRILRRYHDDARAMPVAKVAAHVEAEGVDPLTLAARFRVDTAAAMRRLASLPADALPEPVGLAICDGSGVLTYRRPLADFPLPRLGAGCGLWPLYQALTRPMLIAATPVVQATRSTAQHLAMAVAQPVGQPRLGAEPVFESHMLILPASLADFQAEPVQVGLNCRICPRRGCPARREQSILVNSGDQSF